MIALLVVAPAENRQRQAWLIFLPLAAVVLLGRMSTRLLMVSDDRAEWFGIVVASCAGAWAVVWLLGHRLADWRPTARFIAALILMLAVSGLSCLTHVGLENAEDLRNISLAHGVCSLGLLLGMMLSGRSCRHSFDRRRFMRQLFSSTFLAAAAPLLLVVMSSALVGGLGVFFLLFILFGGILYSVLVAGMLYLLNLPFMLLAFNSPFYGARFHALFCPEQRATAKV